MMKTNETELGTNRTGIGMSPIDAKDLAAIALATPPSSAGDEGALAQTRMFYAQNAAEPLGTVQLPTTLRGAAGSVMKAIKGESMTVLIDKLGERLAFERAGTRLYQGLITKARASAPLPGGPTVQDLQAIADDELAHFHLIFSAIVSLGGDPTTLTPSADVQAVASMGLPQVINDPRTTLPQCLEAILIAELVDNDCWEVLSQLVETMGHAEMAASFRNALAQEQQHLLRVREWVTQSTLRAGAPAG